MWVWWHISSRCDVYISTRFICSYSIWDAEWWWESRLDSLWESRREISMRLTRLMIRLHMSRLDFLCQDMGIFPPCGLTNCHPYGTLARPTIPWHIYYKNLVTFYTEYIQIPYRLTNHINHAFIFNLIFNNIKSMVFGIILYKQWQNAPFLTLYRL